VSDADMDPTASPYYIAGLPEVMARIDAWRIAKGFDAPDNLDDDPEAVIVKLALITTEVAEAIEAARRVAKTDRAARERRAQVREELADVVIRVLSLAAPLGYDMAREIAVKMGRNERRPHQHGKRV
jgi:NTP pyrophosphatase (non-canonical NTP hydrolase)